MYDKNIQSGDYVRHTNQLINGGLRMTVENTNDNSALCSHFAGVEQIHKTEWFPFTDLELVQKGDGGFIDQ